MATVVPTKQQHVDTRDGNHYEIFTVNHTTGTASDVVVADSAVSACELPDDITASAGLAKETTTSAGVTIRNLTSGAGPGSLTFQAGDGVKQVTIASAAATGSYKIIVRHVGNAAGVGAGNSADL